MAPRRAPPPALTSAPRTPYAGTHIRDGLLCFDPRLPRRLGSLSFSMQFRGTPIRVTLARDRLTLAVHPEGISLPIKVAVGADVRELSPGERTPFELGRDAVTSRPNAQR